MGHVRINGDMWKMINALPYGPGLMDQLLAANAALQRFGANELHWRWRAITGRTGPDLKKGRPKHVGPTFPPGSKQEWIREVMSAHHRKGNLVVTAQDIRDAAEEHGMPEGYGRAVIKHMGYLAKSDNAVTIHSQGIYSLAEKYRV